MTSSEYTSCLMTFGDLWSPIDKQNYCYIVVGHKGTSGLLMDILLNVTSALPTVNDLFESTSCKMTLGDP
jgi:hypothetical protein